MRQLSIALALSISALGLLGTGCDARLDKTKIDGITKSMFDDQLKLKVKSVTCPENMDAKKGSKYECTVDLDPEGTVPVDLQVTDDSGTVSVATKYKVITPEAIGQEISKGLHDQKVAATADCGKTVQLAKPGATWKCTAKAEDGKTRDVKVTVDEKSEVSWKLEAE